MSTPTRRVPPRRCHGRTSSTRYVPTTRRRVDRWSRGAYAPRFCSTRVSEQPMTDANGLLGTRFGQKFDVVSIVAEGSRTTVFRAHDTVLDRPVALKIVFPVGDDASEQIARLEREALGLAKIGHRNTPIVYEAGVDAETGLHFVVLEW